MSIDRKGFLASFLAGLAALPVFPLGRHRVAAEEEEQLAQSAPGEPVPITITCIIEAPGGRQISREVHRVLAERARRSR